MGTVGEADAIQNMSLSKLNAGLGAAITHDVYLTAPGVQYVLLSPRSYVTFKTVDGGNSERVTTIDRRIQDNGYTEIQPLQWGMWVRRTGYLPKLIPWHVIEDVDYGMPSPGAYSAGPVPNGAGKSAASAPTVVTKK